MKKSILAFIACIISISVNAQTDSLNNRMNSNSRYNSNDTYPDTTMNNNNLNQDGYQQNTDTGTVDRNNQIQRENNRVYQDSLYKDAKRSGTSRDNTLKPVRSEQPEKTVSPSKSEKPKSSSNNIKTEKSRTTPTSKSPKSTEKKMYLVPDSTLNKK